MGASLPGFDSFILSKKATPSGAVEISI